MVNNKIILSCFIEYDPVIVATFLQSIPLVDKKVTTIAHNGHVGEVVAREPTCTGDGVTEVRRYFSSPAL